MLRFVRPFALGLFMAVGPAPVAPAAMPAFVPGTGVFLKDCSDDFEDETWSYKLNLPKSSHEQDERQRAPGGISTNRLWHEGAKRGTPDVVKRIPTPLGGIDGSAGALLFQTKLSGVPGRLSGEQMQDDLLMKFDRRLGRSIPVAWQPSCTVRVYLPPFDQWENRTGPSFGARADCRGLTPEGEVEPYWPGLFVLFRSETSRKFDHDFAELTIRSGPRGNDLRSHKIEEPGWWTMGMSFTSDGAVHFYASQGIDDLTSADHVHSGFPYGYKCQTFNNFFFNVANADNGQSWSTPWVIDDPKIYVRPPAGVEVAQLYRSKRSTQRVAQGQKPKVIRQGQKQPSNPRPKFFR